MNVFFVVNRFLMYDESKLAVTSNLWCLSVKKKRVNTKWGFKFKIFDCNENRTRSWTPSQQAHEKKHSSFVNQQIADNGNVNKSDRSCNFS